MKYRDIKNRELHRIVATAIIHKRRKYLITQRSFEKKAFPGKWTVPGGGLEVDDYVNVRPTAKAAKKYDLIDGILEEIKMVDVILSGKTPNKAKFFK